MKTLMMLVVFLIIIVIGKSSTCAYLVKTDLDQDTEVDTIAFYPKQHIYLVNIVTNLTFGRFYMNYGVIKNLDDGRTIVYAMEFSGNDEHTSTIGDNIVFTPDLKSPAATVSFSKRQILNTVDSIAQLKDPPYGINIKPIN